MIGDVTFEANCVRVFEHLAHSTSSIEMRLNLKDVPYNTLSLSGSATVAGGRLRRASIHPQGSESVSHSSRFERGRLLRLKLSVNAGYSSSTDVSSSGNNGAFPGGSTGADFSITGDDSYDIVEEKANIKVFCTHINIL